MVFYSSASSMALKLCADCDKMWRSLTMNKMLQTLAQNQRNNVVIVEKKNGKEMANGSSSCGLAWARNIFTSRTKIVLFFGFWFCSEKYSWNSLLLLLWFVQCPLWHWRIRRRSDSVFFFIIIYNSISCAKQCFFFFSAFHSSFFAHMIKHILLLNCEKLRFCLFKRTKTRAAFHPSWTYSVNAVCLGDSVGISTLLFYFFCLIWNCYRLHLRRKKKQNKNVFSFGFRSKRTDRMTKLLARLGST